MIKIKKTLTNVLVHLPIKTLNFDRDHFELISDHIYFLTRKSSISDEIIRQRGNIEDLNMGHWLCIDNKIQTNFNDYKLKSLDVDYLKKELII